MLLAASLKKPADEPSKISKQRYNASIFFQRLEDGPNGSLKRTQAMPIQIFGVDWIQSLDDTPGKSTSSQRKDVPLRFHLTSYLVDYCSDHDQFVADAPSYTRETLQNHIPANELRYFQCFDLALDPDGLNYCFALEFNNFSHFARNFIEGLRELPKRESTILSTIFRKYP